MYQIESFFQEMRRLQREADDKQLKLRLVQNPSRVFQSRVVGDSEQASDRLVAQVNFLGLYGGLGVLPAYFSDEILHNRDDLNALQDFLDTFNNRLFGALFRVWRMGQIFLENGVEAKASMNQDFDQFLCSLAGIPSEEGDAPVYLKCLRRHHFSLFQRSEKTLLGLSNLLTSFFTDVEFDFEEHNERTVPIPQFQRAELGGKTRLAIGSKGNVLVGTRVRDINGQFTIRIADLDYASYMRFLPNGDWNLLLATVVKSYVQNQWECGIKLELRAEEIPSMKLGDHRLSADCWSLSAAATEPAVVSLGGLPT